MWMRKNYLIVFALFFALLFAFLSCKKSSTTETTTTVIPPNVFNGSINIYSSGNDTTLQRFLTGKYNTVQGSILLATADPIDYQKYFVNLERVTGCLLYTSPSPRDGLLS